jgi:D-glycerate 3-kinase
MSDPMRERLIERLSHTPDAPRRVDGYYLPAARWFEGIASGRGVRACVGFLSGPQGAGKSTLASAIVDALAACGRRAVTVSIDDFYLTHDAQRALATRYAGNPFLEFRGYPGTHDIALGTSVIDALRSDQGAGVRVPVYDKSAHGGRGDRSPESQWRVERGPFDLVLVEGWMLGFAPIATRDLPDAAMGPANESLARYAAWHALADALAMLVMRDPSYVVRWRVDAERQRRAAGAAGLSDDEARDYVRRFVPAYAAWVAPMCARPPVEGPRWTATLDEDRHPLTIEERARAR